MKKPKVKLRDPWICDLIAEIQGNAILNTSQSFELPYEYKEIGIMNVLKAQNIVGLRLANGEYRMYLPKGWKLHLPGVGDLVMDSHCKLRMSIRFDRFIVHSPVKIHLNDDGKVQWLEVRDVRNQVTFQSTNWENEEPGDAEKWRNFTIDKQRYRYEAEAFIRPLSKVPQTL